MKARRIVLLVVALGAAGAGIVAMRLNRAVRDGTAIPVSGTIELTEVQASFKQPGRLALRPVDEGDSVTSGQVVAELDMSDLVIEQAGRSSDVWLARAALDELEHGSRPEEIGQAKAALARTESELAQVTAEFARLKDLVEKNVISSSEFDKGKTAFDTATARVREARETLALLELGPRVERIEQARAAWARSRTALDAVNQRLHDAVLRSPFSGMVLSKNAEPGEFVSAGTPVVALGNLGSVWLRAYVNETDLGRVKLGQRATVTTDSYPGKAYEGRVTFISSEAEFTPKTVQTPTERVKLVYRVKITLANPDWELKPGMPADARIMLD